MKEALGGLQDPLIAYAVKANPNPAVLSVLAREGLGADIVSVGEYRAARAAGMTPETILFSGVGKTAEEMAEALAGGLLQFNLESIQEAHTLSVVARSMDMEAPVALRINPGVEAGTHAKITTGTAENKFGLPASQAIEAFRIIRDLPNLKVSGITVHIGSQLTSLAPLEAAFERLGSLIRDLRGEGFDLQIADLGGGLGVPYGAGQPEPPTPAEYGAMIKRITKDWNIRLAFEPGRLISGNAGVLLARVVRVKPGERSPWLIVDAAMNDLMRPALYDAYHQVEAVRPNGEQMTAHVVGPVCESGDTFALSREMDKVSEGELIVFPNRGRLWGGDVERLQQPPTYARGAGRWRSLGAGSPPAGPGRCGVAAAAGVVALAPARVARLSVPAPHRTARRRSSRRSARPGAGPRRPPFDSRSPDPRHPEIGRGSAIDRPRGRPGHSPLPR